MIENNLKEINERISAAAKRSGRDASDVTLVVVTKTRSADDVNRVIAQGACTLGENRVQEASGKKPELKGDFSYRLIGHLQRNKAARAVELFDAVDSIDSIRVARALSKELLKRDATLPVLIEVNSSGESTKFGFAPDEIESAVDEISDAPGLNVAGLMTIGPFTNDAAAIRSAFEMTRGLFDKIRARRDSFDTLSMGMTNDYERAIEEGSTMVRIGRAVFQGR